MTRPKPPEGLQAGGAAFWQAIVDKFELHDHELVVLREACRTIDLLDSLQQNLDRDGVVLKWGDGVRATLPASRPVNIGLRSQGCWRFCRSRLTPMTTGRPRGGVLGVSTAWVVAREAAPAGVSR